MNLMNTTGLCATVLLAAASVQADEFNWLGTSTSATQWKNSGLWSNLTTGAVGYPGAGDHARLAVLIDGWTYIDVQGGCAVGSMYVRNRWGHYRIRTTWTGYYNFTFDNQGAPSTVVIGHSSGGTYWGQIAFGPDGASDRVTRVNLANDLHITNDGAKPSHGRFDIGTYGSIIGGSLSSRRTITIQSLGGKEAMVVQSGAATFTGDWIVDGVGAKLDMNKDAFGNTSNTVSLRNGGVLDLVGLTDFDWTRNLIVESTGGTLLAGSNLGATTGTFTFPAEEGSIGTLTVTGSLALGSGSTLAIPQALPAGTYPLVSATVGIDGSFGSLAGPEDRQGLIYELLQDGTSIALYVFPGTLIMVH